MKFPIHALSGRQWPSKLVEVNSLDYFDFNIIYKEVHGLKVRDLYKSASIELGYSAILGVC